MTNDKILKTDNISHKRFAYELDEVKISFDLRTDIKKQLKAAREILLRAIQDFDVELEKLK